MSTDDILLGPMDSSLIDQTESAYLLKYQRTTTFDDLAVPKSLVGRLDYLKRPRIVLKMQPRTSGFREAASKFLGGRNWTSKSHKNYPSKSKLTRHGSGNASAKAKASPSEPKKRKKVKKKKEEEQREEGGKLSPKRSGRHSFVTTCMVYCLCRALSCIFD